MKRSTTKNALLMSALSLFLCFAMLTGTTFAWFTDTVESGVNQIVAGNLDVELYHNNKNTTTDEKVDGNTKLFQLSDKQLWEPGVMVYENLTVANLGNLALKYQLSVNVTNATKTDDGRTLADVLMVAVVEGGFNGGRAAAEALTGYTNLASFIKSGELYPADNTEGKESSKTYGIVIWWQPSDEDNYYNMNNGEDALTIDLGVKLFATQLQAESDSFGPDYDEEAPVLTVEVTPANVQAYLDGQYGSLDNKKLVLKAGTYGKLTIGTPTKYEGSNTVIYCSNHDATFTDAEAYKAHLADGQWHATPVYTRTINNLTIAAEDGVTVAGVYISSGHVVGPATDYVLDKDITSGSTYYLVHNINGLTFENVGFVNQIDINTSNAQTTINNVTFTGCSFTTAGATSLSLGGGATSVATLPAIRFYNEADNGKVSNLTVDNCTFEDCFQGVYTHHIKGVAVTNSTFTNTVHNAIAIQDHDGACDHGDVVITGNFFDSIGDRVIRFNNVGANTSITLKDNRAQNSGDDNEVIKATSIESGATFDVDNNAWGDGAVIVNDEFKNKSDNKVVSATDSNQLSSAITGGADVVFIEKGEFTLPSLSNTSGMTIIGVPGETVIGGENASTGYGSNFGKDTTIKNVTFSGATNGVRYSYANGGTSTFDNCTFAGDSTYGFHMDKSNGATLIFNNCTFSGFNAFAGDLVKVVFNNCTFLNNGNYGHTNIWSVAEFNNCTWGEGATYGTRDDGVIYIDGARLVNSDSALKAAIEANASKILLANGNYSVRFTNNTSFNVDNMTIVGMGDKVNLSVSSSEAWYGRVQGSKVTFENIHFTSSVGATGEATYNNCEFDSWAICASSNNEKTYFNNCTIKGCLNTSSDFSSGDILVKNCTVAKAEYSGSATMNFENCTIGELISWDMKTVLTGCTVEKLDYTHITSSNTIVVNP